MTITPGMELGEAFSRFDLVNAGLQTAEGLRRVAQEGVEDLAADQRELRAEQSALSAALRNAARAARKTPAAGTAAPGPRRDDD